MEEIKIMIEKYKNAVKELEAIPLEQFTYDKFVSCARIADEEWPENELQSMWEQSDAILPDIVNYKHKGGKDALRFNVKEILIEAIETFEKLI